MARRRRPKAAFGRCSSPAGVKYTPEEVHTFPGEREGAWRCKMSRSFLANRTLVGLISVPLALTAVPGFAQRIFGDILGSVTDSTGAAVRDAKITLRNLDTGRALT